MVTVIGLSRTATNYIQQCGTTGTVNFVKSHITHALIIITLGVTTACKHTAAAITVTIFRPSGKSNPWKEHIGIAIDALSLAVTGPFVHRKSTTKQLKTSINDAVKLFNKTKEQSLIERCVHIGNTRLHKNVPFVTPFSLIAALCLSSVVYRKMKETACFSDSAKEKELLEETYRQHSQRCNERDFDTHECKANAFGRLYSGQYNLMNKFTLCMKGDLPSFAESTDSWKLADTCMDNISEHRRPSAQFIQNCRALETEPLGTRFLRYNQMLKSNVCTEMSKEYKKLKIALHPDQAKTQCKEIVGKLLSCATDAHAYLLHYIMPLCRSKTRPVELPQIEQPILALPSF